MELLTVEAKPLYLQVAEALKRYLDEGAFKVGDPLPTVQTLAKQLGVSRSTLRESMAFLEHEGRLTRRHGVGTFVAEPPRSLLVSPLESFRTIRAEATARGLRTEVIEQEMETVPATDENAELLHISPGTPLIHAQAIDVVEGQPVAYFDALWLVSVVGPGDVPETGSTIFERLMSAPESPLSYRVSELQAVNADTRVAGRLRVAPGTAVLHSLDIYYDHDDQPIGLERNFFASDRYHYRTVRKRGG